MDRKNELTDFFGSSFTKEYLKCSDYLVRRSVTGISASCELLRETLEKSGSREGGELIDSILTMCCDLMRNAELGSVLASGSLAAEELVSVRADIFLKELAAKCEAAADEKCSITVKSVPEVYIRTDRETLRFLILGFVRKQMLLADGEKTELEIECETALKTLNISVRSLRTFVDGGNSGIPDVFSEYTDEMISGLAERISASAVSGGDSLTVEIPLTGSSGTAIAEAPPAELQEGFFNPFNLMLRDI